MAPQPRIRSRELAPFRPDLFSLVSVAHGESNRTLVSAVVVK